MVPEVGIEPTRGCPRRILNPVRLPISPLRHFDCVIRFDPEYSIPLIKLENFISKSNKRSINGVSGITGRGFELKDHEFYRPRAGLGPGSGIERNRPDPVVYY